MSELPSGWSTERLGNLCSKIGSGSTPKGGSDVYYSEGIPLIRSMNVHFHGFKREGLVFLDELQAEKLKGVEVRANDVLLNITGASIGRVSLAPNDLDGARVNQHVAIIRLHEGIAPAYIKNYLACPELQALINETGSGVTRPALTKEKIESFEIPLPPLNEQKRIAAKLDALLERVDACRARLERVPLLLKRFRQAVLAAATSGQLTEDWRIQNPSSPSGKTLLEQVRNEHRAYWIESQLEAMRKAGRQPKDESWKLSYKPAEPVDDNEISELPTSWTWGTGAELVTPGAEIVYGIVQPGPKLEEGIPYVRGMDIENGRILVNQLMKTSPVIADRYWRSSLEGGDVLLGIIRATKVAIVPKEIAGGNITQGTARFRPSSVIRTKYLAITLGAESTQAWLHAHYRGIDMPGLNLADVRRVPLPLAPLDEQDEIVRRVETLFAYVDRLEARYQQARAAVERLTPALLAKAFRGELVPQDPGDEPAAALLARLQAARLQPASKPKPRASATRKRPALQPE